MSSQKQHNYGWEEKKQLFEAYRKALEKVRTDVDELSATLGVTEPPHSSALLREIEMLWDMLLVATQESERWKAEALNKVVEHEPETKSRVRFDDDYLRDLLEVRQREIERQRQTIERLEAECVEMKNELRCLPCVPQWRDASRRLRFYERHPSVHPDVAFLRRDLEVKRTLLRDRNEKLREAQRQVIKLEHQLYTYDSKYQRKTAYKQHSE